MPTYSYKCTECGHKFEAFQSMKDDPLRECPQCQGPVERLIGAGAGIVFKGSGFYVTDYKKNGSAESSKKTSDSPANGTPAKTENKPAAASAGKD